MSKSLLTYFHKLEADTALFHRLEAYATGMQGASIATRLLT
ncbi:hypothetical protein NA78x_005932 [Anatilimnocola sp. NA78]